MSASERAMKAIAIDTVDGTRLSARLFAAQGEATLWARVTGLFTRFATGATA